MHNRSRFANALWDDGLRPGHAALVILLMLLFLIFLLVFLTFTAQPAQAQAFNVIYNFTDGNDGADPYAGVTIDGAGNLYGTAYSGGAGYGTVYKLTRSGSNWSINPLYSFTGGSDGASPKARVIFGPQGLLYGTTSAGGGYRAGVIFRLGPSVTCATALCSLRETVLYEFPGAPHGWMPALGDLLFDQAGNMYGTTYWGGYIYNPSGVVYEQTPQGSWGTEIVLFAPIVPDGYHPYNGVIFDTAGNLYGTMSQGGASGAGIVFELAKHVGSVRTESVLKTFDNGSDGGIPISGLTLDQSGNLYGATSTGGTGGGGVIFELSPLNGGWTYTPIYSLTGYQDNTCGPWGTLVMDGVGNLYGTTYCDGANNAGSVFKLTNTGSGWTYTSLHDFAGGSDGRNPISNVIFDVAGNLYGTASAGGAYGAGVVFEITP